MKARTLIPTKTNLEVHLERWERESDLRTLGIKIEKIANSIHDFGLNS